MSKLVNISLHGDLGAKVGKRWSLAVSSVKEAIHAIEILSARKLYKYLLDKDKHGIKYRVLINKKDFLYQELPDASRPETIASSELVMERKNLESIDIVPVIEGADGKSGGILGAILGVILIVVGVLVAVGTLGGGAVVSAGFIVAGLGLIAAGVSVLLAKPPEFEDFRRTGGGGRASYLFSGPENVINEGGPVPVGYGQLLVGSQVIAANYSIKDVDARTKRFR